MKNIILFLVVLLVSIYCKAQNPTLIKDISIPFGNEPSGYTEFNGKVYFCATDSAHGRELWVTDGTNAGTNIVKDINTQSPNGFIPDGYGCPYFGGVYTGKLNGELFFNGTDTTHGMALWKTDGTTNGTVLIKDISELGFYDSWQNSSSYFYSEPINNKLVFVSSDTIHGQELWVTDGTSSGTQLLQDIYPGQTGSSIGNFILFNNKLYFTADDSTHGSELWVTDGTSAGTNMFVDMQTHLGLTQFSNNGTFNPYSRALYDFNNELFLVDGAGVLFKTDGTVSGTIILSDSNNNYAPHVKTQQTINNAPDIFFTEMGGKLYFIGEDSTNNKELWTTDGTQTGTYMVKEINPTGSAILGELVSINNELLFMASTVSFPNDFQLWKSDGTANGTAQVKKLTTNNNPQGGLYLYKYDNKVYFNARSDAFLRSFWVTDGTTNGTEIVDTFFVMSGKPITYNSRMYLRANGHLWESEGDSLTTKIIKPLGDTNSSVALSFGTGYDGYYDYVEYNGSLLFTADYGLTGNEPYLLCKPSAKSELNRIDF